ncbi:MAG TPA: hypothetical protein VFS26_08040, partial [Solirubrobacterales bacterium]|nr:hypothetical protein [Solirubrobacterales bacterium]
MANFVDRELKLSPGGCCAYRHMSVYLVPQSFDSRQNASGQLSTFYNLEAQAPAEEAVAILSPASGAPWVVAAAALWGTAGTAATLCPPGTNPIAIGSAATGIGGALLFLAANRRAAKLIADLRTRPLVLFGAAFMVAHSLSFYGAMATGG